jgi:AcrR family transcriptional regulator
MCEPRSLVRSRNARLSEPSLSYDGPVTQVQGRVRAAALPLEERRSAIVAATLPLFLEQGAGVTTREIAQAAGIAEGTIFRVFEDKTALLDAVIEAALDPAPTDAAIDAFDPNLSFEDRLIAAVEILRERVLYVFNVLSAASGTTRGIQQQRSTDLPALIAIFESEAERLSRAPADAARVLRGLTFACVHPAFGTDEPLTSKEIVAVLLDGIRRPSAGEAPC